MDVFLAFFDDNGQEVKGYFDLQERTEAYVCIKSKGNLTYIPWNRVLKLKVREDQK